MVVRGGRGLRKGGAVCSFMQFRKLVCESKVILRLKIKT